jgi:hypothetical protein
MKTLSAPRRIKSMTLGRPILYTEVRGTSASGHFTLFGRTQLQIDLRNETKTPEIVLRPAGPL